MSVQVRFRKGDTVFHPYGGVHEGREGVHLAEDGVAGIGDAPVRTTWKTGAFQNGSRQKARKWLHRDMELAFHIISTKDAPWEFNESEFRRIFDYQVDPWDDNPEPTVLEVESELSGIRMLDVLMYEEPESVMKIDPHKNQHCLLILKLRAGQPFWYEHISENNGGITVFEESTASSAGTITVSNPTDQIMYQKWGLTRATWVLPDVSWVGKQGERAPGGPHEERVIDNIVVTEDNGFATVDLDGQELMFRDANDTNILAQLAGKFFNYPIPPYTPPTDLPVAYSSAPSGGARAELVQPRLWSRPWGQELAAAGVPGLRPPQVIRFIIPGTYSYRIPDWCDTVDIILLSGGGGGGGGHIIAGQGGDPGQWVTHTLVRGTDIPWETERIHGVVGAGGLRGATGNNHNGKDGGNTTAEADGITPLVAVGGDGSGNTGSVYGRGAGSQTFNGELYPGGGQQQQPGMNGRAPGGGGAGGWPFSPGGAGGRGQVWFRAYKAGP